MSGASRNWWAMCAERWRLISAPAWRIAVKAPPTRTPTRGTPIALTRRPSSQPTISNGRELAACQALWATPIRHRCGGLGGRPGPSWKRRTGWSTLDDLIRHTGLGITVHRFGPSTLRASSPGTPPTALGADRWPATRGLDKAPVRHYGCEMIPAAPGSPCRINANNYRSATYE
jgi:hypothetical protein